MKYSFKSLIELLHQRSVDEARGLYIIRNEGTRHFFSYKSLFRDSVIVLNNLQKAKVSKGDDVLILVKDNYFFLVAFWSCILGGFKPIPLSFGRQEYQKDKILKVCEQLGNYYVIGESEALNLLAGLNEYSFNERMDFALSHQFLIDDLLIDNGMGDVEKAEQKEIAYIQYSSGSTGDPKGVALTHGNLCANIKDIATRSKMTKDDRTLSWMPLSHDMGLICFHLTSVLVGVNQYLIPTDSFIRTPLRWMDYVDEFRITQIYSPNFGLHYFTTALLKSENHNWDLSCLRLLFNGAEPISIETCLKFIHSLSMYGINENVMYSGYGLAEACVAVSLPKTAGLNFVNIDRFKIKIGKPVEFLHLDAPNSLKLAILGKPLDNCEIKIVDQEKKVVDEKIVGEIIIKGANVTSLYYRDPKTTNKIIGHGGWLSTGDLGFFEGGNLIVCGRIKQLIVINGQNFFSYDIEKYLIDVLGLKNGRVVVGSVYDDIEKCERLVVYIVDRKRNQSVLLKLLDEINNAVLNYFGIEVWYIVPIDSIPKTTSGKVQYNLLKYKFEQGFFDNVVIKKHFDLDFTGDFSNEILRWKTILSQFIGVKDDLFSYNIKSINSLSAIRLVNKINDCFCSEISVKDLFGCKDLLELISFVKKSYSKPIEFAPSIIGFEVNKDTRIMALPIQRRFWLWQQVNPNNRALIITLKYTLSGRFVQSLVKEVIKSIIDKHPTFGCVFESDGESLNIVKYAFDISEVLFFVKTSDILSNINDQIHHLNGPLFKIFAYSTDDNRFNLVLRIHHLIFDGWSSAIFIQEFITIYNNLLSDSKFNLKPSSSRFWEAVNYKLSRVNQNQSAREYWLNEFYDYEPTGMISLFDKGRFNESNTEPIRIDIPALIVNTLFKIVEAEHITLYSLLLSSINICLSKLSGQHDLIVGTVLLGRDRAYLEEELGCFINTIPLRSKIDYSEKLLSYVKKIHQKILTSSLYQDFPYELLLDELSANFGQVEDLFDIVVICHDMDIFKSIDSDKDVYLSSVNSENHQIISGLQFDFYVSNLNQTITLEVKYDSTKYTRHNITLLIDRLFLVLGALDVSSSVSISNIDIITQSENELLKEYSNGERRDTSSFSILDAFRSQCLQSANDVSIIFQDKEFSYEDLRREVSLLSSFFQNTLALGYQSKVVVLLPRSERVIVSMIAIWSTGNIYVPIDDEFPDSRVIEIVNDCSAEVVITTENRISGLVAYLPNIKFVNGDGSANTSCENFKYSIPDIAYILYTSGSTGKPKGVLITYSSICNYVSVFIDYFNISSSDTFIQQSSISFDTSFEEILPIICTGGKLVILKKGGRSIDELIYNADHHKATLISTTPLVLNELNKARFIGSFRTIISGGDVLKEEHVDFLIDKTNIYNTYGPSETTICASYKFLESLDDVCKIGKPIFNHTIRLLNKNNEVVPIGVLGEICIWGPGVGRGYLGQKSLQCNFVKDPVTQELFFKTGDLAFWDNSGDIVYWGRMDNQVKLGGYRVELKEVESVLQGHSKIEDAIIYLDKEGKDKYLVAFYKSSENIEIREIRSFLIDRLPYFMIPSVFIKVRNLPLLINGKIDRQFIKKEKEIDGYNVNRRDGSEMHNRTEIDVSRIWSEVLGLFDLNRYSNFFAVGGNSIFAMKIISKIKEFLHKEISISDLYSNPTICELAIILDEREFIFHTNTSKLDIREYDLSHAQKRIWYTKYNRNDSLQKIHVAINVIGKLDVKTLKKAYSLVLTKHDLLKTIFFEKDNEIKQQIVNKPPYKDYFREIDLKEDKQISEVDLINTLRSELEIELRLDESPIAKLSLFHINENRSVLFFVIHHLIADGKAVEIILKDIFVIYQDLIKGKELQLDDFNISYRNYVENEKNVVYKYENFWLKMFDGGVPDIVFPYDFSSKKGYEPGFLSIVIKEDTIQKLEDLASANFMSLEAFLFAAYNLTIARWYQQTDIVTGLLVSGRTRSEYANIVGLFNNYLPIRTIIEKEKSFVEYLHDQRDLINEAVANQEYPFDLMVEKIGNSRMDGKNAFYKTIFNYQVEDFANELSIDEISLQKMPLNGNPSEIDAHFDLIRTNCEIGINLYYNQMTFRYDTISHVLESYNELLDLLINKNLIIDLNEYLQTENTNVNSGQLVEIPKLNICSSFIMEPIEDVLNFWKEEIEINLDISFTPYNQVEQYLIEYINAEKKKKLDNVELFFVRPVDWIREYSLISENELAALLKRRLSRFMELFEIFCKLNGSRILVFEPDIDRLHIENHLCLLEPIYDDLSLFYSKIDNISVLKVSDVADHYEVLDCFNSISNDSAHIPFTDELYSALGTCLMRNYYSSISKSYKVIVLDADNTLWKGVCGEDSKDEIVIDKDYEFLQNFILRKYNEGFLLAICSKNNDSDFWDIFNNHPGMILKKEHFICFKINWKNKKDNIIELSKQLNLGLDSFIFIDDSDLECAEMEAFCPEVLSINLPNESLNISTFLNNIWELDRNILTIEDVTRNEMYKDEEYRIQLRAQSTTLEDFIRQLNVKICVKQAEIADLNRIHQMFYRVNQFNANGRQFDVGELPMYLKRSNYFLWTINIKDNFGDYGLTGVILGEIESTRSVLIVESMLLSCRVLGRGVETQLVDYIKDFANEKLVNNIEVKVEPTGRNQVFLDFFKRSGWIKH